LIHEFTHALHYADQAGRGQTHPVWLMEGLASLYEHSKIVDGHAVPQLTYRLANLQAEVRENHQMPFAKMMKLEHQQFTSHQYPQARYMFMYLYDTGKLREWYDAYTAGYATDSSGAAAWEKVYGKKLDEIEHDWAAWLLKLTPPTPANSPGSASLGISIKQLPDSIQIVDFAPSSGAQLGGLSAEDAIVDVDGQRIIDAEDLVEVLGRHKVGDKVKIEYRRAGEYRQTEAVLTPLPAVASPQSKPATDKR
jgi:hypothetical protein